jgi:hypothetical protein
LLRDEAGDRHALVAERDGVVVMLRRTRLVGPGDLVAFPTGDDVHGGSAASVVDPTG